MIKYYVKFAFKFTVRETYDRLVARPAFNRRIVTGETPPARINTESRRDNRETKATERAFPRSRRVVDECCR